MQWAIRLHALCIIWALAIWARADDNAKLVPSITVVGQGEVQVEPDLANVTVGVTTEAESASDAVKQNNQRMTQLLATLRGLNIADKHVQTSNFSVAPKQVFDRNGQQPPKIVGYTVNNQVHVKVFEIARLGAILDAVVEAGSNSIQGINFSLAEPKPHLDQARRKAMVDARQRAELYAAAGNVKLGGVLLIQEQSASIPRPFFAGELRAAPMAAAVPVATGEQTLSANVTVTYQIAP